MQLFLLRVTISRAVFAVVAMAGISPLLAADPARKSEAPKVLVIGYSDANLDGVNDRFRDANGDGLDDVSLKPYPHRFLFVDQDGDGTNDVFVDQDGDGVNDLEAQYKDRDGDGICDNVIDFDGDGINDITGEKYDRHSLKGYRFGRVDEERGTIHRRFIDEDRDGMNDLIRRFHPPPGPGPRMDHFIDEDGDGIADGRRLHPPMAGSPLMERLRGRPKPDGRPKQPPPRPRRHPPRDRKGGR